MRSPKKILENHLCKLRVMLHHMLITWCGSFSGSRYYDVFENDTGFWWVGALGRPLQPDTKHSLVFRDLKLSFCCRPARVAKRLSAKHTIISQETGVLRRVKDSFGTKYTGVSMGAVIEESNSGLLLRVATLLAAPHRTECALLGVCTLCTLYLLPAIRRRVLCFFVSFAFLFLFSLSRLQVS